MAENPEDSNPNENPDGSEQPQSSGDAGGFGLNEPTGQFNDLDQRLRRESRETDFEVSPDNHPGPQDDLKYKNMGWKGIDDDEEPEEEDEDEDVTFGAKEPIPEDELDMTPMVDVTFLLLIFFMVTASFTLQKSLEQPHAKSDQPSPNPIEEPDTPPDYVQVNIDQNNTYYVTTRDFEELECPSDSEMRAQVRSGFEIPGTERLIIVAHVESLHSKVVTAWDAGVINNVNKIEIQTTEEDY